MLRFSADEVFEMAQDMERQGIEFYRLASQKSRTPELQSLLANLADMEQRHLQTFTELREALSPDDRRRDAPVDPEDAEEHEHYIRTLVQSHVFGSGDDVWRSSQSALTATDVLTRAAEIEKDSIVFLLELQELVPAHQGRKEIDQILREELRHLRMLHARLKAE